MAGQFRFSFGPWNIHEGADTFGPALRDPFSLEEKLGFYRKLGFEGIQFHDDDIVPNLDRLSHEEILKAAKRVGNQIENAGLTAEFVAPRLWEDPRTVDGAFTAYSKSNRDYAWARSKLAIDMANVLGTNRVVLWLAREGTYMREAKDARAAVEQIVAAVNGMLEYDRQIRILIEPKPNEPMDQSYIPTAGHAIGLAALSVDPTRVGVLIESAHAILAGLDPSDEMAYALAHGKLWSVHLNDQNGPKYDQDRAFGAVDLRRAFNQVRVLDMNDYGKNGGWVGFDVKALRTQRREVSTKHLRNSREIFLALLDISRGLSESKMRAMIGRQDYEELERYIMGELLGG